MELFTHFPMGTFVNIDLEDAQAIAQNIEERLKYDEEIDKKYWETILERLNTAVRHCETY